MAVRQALVRSWSRRGAAAWLLWPMACLYRVAWQLRQLAYRIGLRTVHRVPVPVIVVGNVVAGGAGKTPIVMAVVAHLQSRGLRPGVVSRGYGRQTSDCRLVMPDSSPAEVGDEPLLTRQRTGAPVAVATSRIQAAQALLAQHPELDLLVCDDGLQHRALHRDVEICVFDERGIGNGFLLPAGPLREPWPRDVDLIVASGALPPGVNGHRVQRTLGDHALRQDGTQLPLRDLSGQPAPSPRPLLAVAGIARPQAFFDMLRARGLTLARTVALPDHADFDATPWLDDENHTVLCTEKDAVKLWRRRPDALAVPLVVSLDAPFWHALEQLLVKRGTARIRAKLSSADGHTPSRPACLPGHQGAAGV